MLWRKRKSFGFLHLPVSKPKHFAFRQENTSLCSQIIIEVEISNATPNAHESIKARALWDTGASGTVIVPSIAKKMGLIPTDRVKVAGVNNVSMADVVQVSIGLPNKVMVKDASAMICELTGEFELLIGMDIISLGDMIICNGDNKTSFSFVMPSFPDKPDWIEKSNQINNGH